MEYPDFFGKGPTPCSQVDPDMFLPDAEDSNYKNTIKAAKEICQDCPYFAECLEYAYKNNEVGIWGGTTDRDRRRMRRRSIIRESRGSQPVMV